MASILSCVANRVDLDPHGVQLAAVNDPLKEATSLLTMLLQHSAQRLKVQQLAFEVGSTTSLQRSLQYFM